MYEEYESEENRFKSFFNYPKPHPPVEDLVVAGFFYIGLGEKDTCQCYSCGVKFNNWTSEDNPIEGHKKFRPKCKFIKTYKDSEKSAPANIPYYPTANTTFISNAESEPKNQNVKQIQEPKPGGTNLMYSKLNKPVNHISKEKENLYSSIIGQSTARTEGMNYKMYDYYSPAPSQSQVPINPHQQNPTPNNSSGPKYEEFEDEEKRGRSFKKYPKNYPTIEKLVAAGFYYLGLGGGSDDDCQCYYCGVRVFNWTKEDDPMKEHEKFRPNCAFIKKTLKNPRVSALASKPLSEYTNMSQSNKHQHYPAATQGPKSVEQQETGSTKLNRYNNVPNHYSPAPGQSQVPINPHQQYPTPNNSNYSSFQALPSGRAEGNQLAATYPPRQLYQSQQSYNPIQQGLSQQSHILPEQRAYYGNQQPQPQPYSIHAAATNLYASNVASFQQPTNQLNSRMSNVEYYGGASYGHNPYNGLYEQGLDPRPILLSSVNSVAPNTQYNNPNGINIAPGGSMNSQIPQPQPRRFSDQLHRQTSHEASIPALTQNYQQYPQYPQYPQGNTNYQP